MKKNIFELKTHQLKGIATSLKNEVEKGLEKDKMEILCLPTYINPKKNITNGKALVLDLGGTNYRAAIIEFVDGQPVIHPENGFQKNLSIMKEPSFTRENLFQEIADLISELNLEGVKSIGYCFSYPAEPMLNGDAKLIRWTKGVGIKEMIDDLIGEPLLEYLNKRLEKANFTSIKVINDTIASLFAGLTDKEAQAHIGLIVGTGTNMATFIHADKIKKLNPDYKQKGLVPINLESGNFRPPFLNVIDDKVDKYSDSRGAQRFEKAISGMYLGRILEYYFSGDEFPTNFDARMLTNIMSYPDMYKRRYVRVAHWIYERSAKLVAASIAGLVLVLVSHDKSIKKIRLTAEGSLFWSEDSEDKKNDKYKCYKDLVLDELYNLLKEFGHSGIEIFVDKKDNANLIGSAIAALS